MGDKWQRMKFKELRFEYYVSGRMMWFSDTMSIASMLLGHSVELHIKQALIEHDSKLSEDRKVARGHNLKSLYDMCKKRGIFSDVNVSDDLILYMSDLLNQRYPSQSIKTAKTAAKRGHAIGSSITLIQAYDDLVIQFDDSLRKKYGDEEMSIGMQASHYINRQQGRAFFHSNMSALRNLKEYSDYLKKEYDGAEERFKSEGQTPETIEYNLKNHKNRLSVFAGAPNSLWTFNKLSVSFNQPKDEPKAGYVAEKFSYPGRIYKPRSC